MHLLEDDGTAGFHAPQLSESILQSARKSARKSASKITSRVATKAANNTFSFFFWGRAVKNLVIWRGYVPI